MDDDDYGKFRIERVESSTCYRPTHHKNDSPCVKLRSYHGYRLSTTFHTHEYLNITLMITAADETKCVLYCHYSNGYHGYYQEHH